MNKYYAVLGLPVTASKDEVRKKYRKLVLLWHPDKNSSPGAAEKFVQITEAYDILTGERSAPRAKIYSGAAYRAQAKPKTRTEQERERFDRRNEQLRMKFENMRQYYLRAPDYQRQKDHMYIKATLFFCAAGLVFLVAIILPFTVVQIGNIVWMFPVGLASGIHLFWRGGRVKLRADMIYSGRKDYSLSDIHEFFRNTSGFTID